MTAFDTKQDTEARAERLARVRARRAERPRFGPEEQTTVGELQPGDFLVLVPTQQAITGTRYECLLEGTLTTWTHYVMRHGRHSTPVEARALLTADPRWGKFVYPASFRCTVRRAR